MKDLARSKDAAKRNQTARTSKVALKPQLTQDLYAS